MKKNSNKIAALIFLALNSFIQYGCSGGSEAAAGGASGGGSGGGATATVVVPGIGTGGSAYVAGTLDGTWTSGCEGGSNGDNWSYIRTMTISGDSVVQNNNWYRQNQTCTGTVDTSEVISFTLSWGSYDTTGYSSNATYSNFSLLITPLTANGLARMGNYGVCTFASFSLNVATQCRTSTTGSYKYYLADNIYLPETVGPQSGAAIGIGYAFGTFRKVVSNPSAIDGIYAYTDGSTFTKLIISGDRYAHMIANDIDSSRIAISSGAISAGPNVSLPAGALAFAITTKSKIWQPRSTVGATDLNSLTVCGFNDYANGIVKNLLSGGTCATNSPTHLLYKLTGNSLQFALSNLPLPVSFPSLILYAPWKYSP